MRTWFLTLALTGCLPAPVRAPCGTFTIPRCSPTRNAVEICGERGWYLLADCDLAGKINGGSWKCVEVDTVPACRPGTTPGTP